jgi:hypothetical protein
MKKIRLFLQIPSDDAQRVINTLWARGILSEKQYERNLRLINNLSARARLQKNKKTEQLIAGIREFYKKQVK